MPLPTRLTVFSLLALALVLPGAPAFAAATQEAVKEEAKQEEAAPEKPAGEEMSPEELERVRKAAEEHRKAVEDSREKIHKLTESLTMQEKQHFQLAYFTYNMIKTVEMVREDVTNAVKSCGEKNPDKKEKLDARFAEWNAKVDPVMQEANGHLDNMVIAQDYAKDKDIKETFKSLDVARDKARNQIQKIPVSTPEACDYLYHKLDETEERLVGLLRSTLVTPPQSTISETEEKETPKQEEALPADDPAKED